MNTEQVQTTSPVVTQEEAQSFFQRVATMAVGYSAQANRIEDMAREVSSLSQRISAMAEEQAKLRSEVSETWDFAHKLEAERDQAQLKTEQVERDFSSARDQWADKQRDLENSLAQAHDAMVQRDQRIAAQDKEIVELRQALLDKDTINQDLSESRERLKSDRDYWQRRANSAEQSASEWSDKFGHLSTENDKAKAKLATVQAKLEEFRSLFQPQAEPEAESRPASVAVNF